MDIFDCLPLFFFALFVLCACACAFLFSCTGVRFCRPPVSIDQCPFPINKPPAPPPSLFSPQSHRPLISRVLTDQSSNCRRSSDRLCIHALCREEGCCGHR